jgi:hypothetical protein
MDTHKLLRFDERVGVMLVACALLYYNRGLSLNSRGCFEEVIPKLCAFTIAARYQARRSFRLMLYSDLTRAQVLAPLRGLFIYHSDPWLAPWALSLRRFAAKQPVVIVLLHG